MRSASRRLLASHRSVGHSPEAVPRFVAMSGTLMVPASAGVLAGIMRARRTGVVLREACIVAVPSSTVVRRAGGLLADELALALARRGHRTVVSYFTPSGTGTGWMIVTPLSPEVLVEESTATNAVNSLSRPYSDAVCLTPAAGLIEAIGEWSSTALFPRHAGRRHVGCDACRFPSGGQPIYCGHDSTHAHDDDDRGPSGRRLMSVRVRRVNLQTPTQARPSGPGFCVERREHFPKRYRPPAL
jgi:hypothetical protein